jgi:hypothetical protein
MCAHFGASLVLTFGDEVIGSTWNVLSVSASVCKWSPRFYPTGSGYRPSAILLLQNTQFKLHIFSMILNGIGRQLAILDVILKNIVI